MSLSDLWSLGGSFAASYVSYVADVAARPFSATFFVTMRCNIRCSYCYFPLYPIPELSLPEIDILFSRLRQSGVNRLSLTGGEPMARQDLGEIISIGKSKGLFVTVNSNMLFYRERKEALKDADLIFASLDGDKREHERQRGEGSWDGVLDAIKDLRARGTKVVAICVLTTENHHVIPHMLDIAERGGFQIHFHPITAHPVYHPNPPPTEPSDDAARAMWRSLIEHKKNGRPVASSMPYLECLARWEDFKVVNFYDPAEKCAAGRGFFFIEPNGDAYSCIFVKQKLQPVNLMRSEWVAPAVLPCTTCRAGPLLELRMLFEQPVRAAANGLTSYLRAHPARAAEPSS